MLTSSWCPAPAMEAAAASSSTPATSLPPSKTWTRRRSSLSYRLCQRTITSLNTSKILRRRKDQAKTTPSAQLEESQLHQDHHFVLVHGAGHGGWCWYKIRCFLEAAGHKVSCVDLAGAGIHRADPNLVVSIEQYDAPLFALLSALPHHHKVILVGHSTGGHSVIHALHAFKNKIKLAIFIAAAMLPLGSQAQQNTATKDGDSNSSKYSEICEFGYALGPTNPPTSIIIKKQFQKQLLYQLSPIEDSTLASMLLRPCPAIFQKVKFDKREDLNETRRVYIKTTHDNMMNQEKQDAVIRGWPPDEVLEIASDHSPFFSAPMELCRLLIKASSSSSDSGKACKCHHCYVLHIVSENTVAKHSSGNSAT